MKTPLSLPLAALLALALLSACGGEVPETEPEGGYNAFRDALASGDAERIWGALDPRIHDDLTVVHQQIQTTADRIAQLQPSDREDARRATGMDELLALETPYDLFVHVYQPARVPDLSDGSRYAESLEAADVALLDDTHAVVLTRGDQEFQLVRIDDGTWRVGEPVASWLAAAVAPIPANLSSVERAVRLFGSGADELERMRRLGLVE